MRTCAMQLQYVLTYVCVRKVKVLNIYIEIYLFAFADWWKLVDFEWRVWQGWGEIFLLKMEQKIKTCKIVNFG